VYKLNLEYFQKSKHHLKSQQFYHKVCTACFTYYKQHFQYQGFSQEIMLGTGKVLTFITLTCGPAAEALSIEK